MVRATVAVSLAVPADAVVSATDVVPATGVVVDSPLEGVACELTIPQFLGLSASTRRISPSRRAARLPTGDLDDASPTQPTKVGARSNRSKKTGAAQQATPARLRVANPLQGDIAKPDYEREEERVRRNSPGRNHIAAQGCRTIENQLSSVLWSCRF